MLATADDLWILACTVYGESRGESILGQVAVAWTVKNRCLVHARWHGQTVTAVCLAPWQFSCWNPKDKNRPKLMALTLDDAVFVACFHIALDVLGEQIDSPVGEATHYYSGSRVPAWARGREPVVIIGHHRFFEHIL